MFIQFLCSYRGNNNNDLENDNSLDNHATNWTSDGTDNENVNDNRNGKNDVSDNNGVVLMAMVMKL